MKLSDTVKPWKVEDFKKVNKPWGPFRKVIGEIDIDFIDSIIYLMKENSDGRMSITMHKKDDGTMLTKAGFYWVDESDKNQQKALDAMYAGLEAVYNKCASEL